MIINGLLFLIFHFLADFTFQSQRLVDAKKSKFSFLVLHCIAYGILMAIPVILSFTILKGMAIIFIFIILHFAIDYIKIKTDTKQQNYKFQYFSFIIDQILHIGLIILIVGFADRINDSITYINKFLLDINSNIDFNFLVKTIFSIIFVMSPSSIFIKNTFNYLFYKDNSDCKNIDNDKKESNVGKVVGKLERLIIVILGSLGLYTSIAIVLTAKSIARFNKMSEEDFAEKYLVGTLLSLLLAIICLIILKL